MQKKERFETLFRSYYGQMLMLAKLLLKDDEGAKDVVSDIFTDVWEDKIHLDGGLSKSYLMMCVRNRCLDVLGHLSMRERVYQLLTLDNSLEVTSYEDSEAVLVRIREIADSLLTPRDREVLLMKYERQMKYREIALQLAISETAVYNHLSNALKILRENLKTE